MILKLTPEDRHNPIQAKEMLELDERSGVWIWPDYVEILRSPQEIYLTYEEALKLRDFLNQHEELLKE